jgi:hypothetical protein
MPCPRASEREEARGAARAAEKAAEDELRAAHGQAAELRSKSRPVEDYLAADRGAALAAAGETLAAARRRLQAAEGTQQARARRCLHTLAGECRTLVWLYGGLRGSELRRCPGRRWGRAWGAGHAGLGP